MLEKKSYPIRINNRQILLLLSLLIIPLASAELGGETITLKTYYPSPYGSYQKMKITKLLTAGSATDALLIDGRIVIGSGNTTLPLNYGNAKKTEYVQVDVNGSQAVNDLWLKSVGKWASELGTTYTAGVSPQPLTTAGNETGTMILPKGKTYTVMLWMYWFECADPLVQLYLDGRGVRSYTGYGGNSPGCDQNSIFHVEHGLPGGSHIWSTSLGTQQTFMWLAFPEN
ncbi:MAG: hypothetical protein WCS77_08290 [Elusimicrobiaceae bacterium]